jgi:hypothetical protein
VVQEDVVTDLGRLADDDTVPVVDEQSSADGRGGVYLDAGEKPGEFGEPTSGQRVIPVPERVGDAIQPDRVNARVEQEYLEPVPGGGVFRAGGPDVLGDVREQRSECVEHCDVIVDA